LEKYKLTALLGERLPIASRLTIFVWQSRDGDTLQRSVNVEEIEQGCNEPW
jgi:hypothetical protein